MTRSQAHKVVIMNYASDGKAVAEGKVAESYLKQGAGPYTQPVGPTSGPLKGSWIAGPVPSGFPSPKGPEDGEGMMSMMAAGDQIPTENPVSLEQSLASQSNPEPASERTFPIGPFTINSLEDHDAGIAIELTDGDVQVGDTVLIEATGNTSINGSYEVVSVDGSTIVVDNMVVLDAPIEAKGRLTVTGGAGAS